MSVKNRCPEGFKLFPSLFLQSGYPLKLNIYLLDSKVSPEPALFRKKGDLLEIDETLRLGRMRLGQVLARTDELKEALAYYEGDPLYESGLKLS